MAWWVWFCLWFRAGRVTVLPVERGDRALSWSLHFPGAGKCGRTFPNGAARASVVGYGRFL
ncbi:hypothetical protein GGR01_001267 [Acetobacter oeni]|nr:hypothetical protein [Acetobacter oeni]